MYNPTCPGKKQRSPGRSSSSGTGTPCSRCSAVSRGSHTLKQKWNSRWINPEQSNPNGEPPPHRYGVPTRVRPNRMSSSPGILFSAGTAAARGIRPTTPLGSGISRESASGRAANRVSNVNLVIIPFVLSSWTGTIGTEIFHSLSRSSSPPGPERSGRRSSTHYPFRSGSRTRSDVPLRNHGNRPGFESTASLPLARALAPPSRTRPVIPARCGDSAPSSGPRC